MPAGIGVTAIGSTAYCVRRDARLVFTLQGRRVARRAIDRELERIRANVACGTRTIFPGSARAGLTTERVVSLLRSARLAVGDAEGLGWPVHAGEARELSWALVRQANGGCRAANAINGAVRDWAYGIAGDRWEHAAN